MTEEVLLELGERKCSILIGHGLMDSIGELMACEPPGRRFAIITNPTVNSLYGKQVAGSLERHGFAHMFFEVPDSETSKSLEAANRLYGELSRNGFDRNSCIMGLGGGAIGDLAGFVAATYMRGIGLIHIPTTLLAQVDSAIGGKTGVNIPEGKNLVGAFHQPEMVVSDVAVLKTLPDDEFISGMAEVVKYGMILDAEFFCELERSADRLRNRDVGALLGIVARCSAIKAGIVAEDERDRGRRIVLNYGHTLGHALESASGYKYRHGEAVALGMIFAGRISMASDLLAVGDFQRLIELLESFGLPTRMDEKVDAETLLGFMEADKKNTSEKIRMVLPTGIGRSTVSEVSREILLRTVEAMR